MERPTKHPGVFQAGGGKYRIRGTYTDPRTSRRREVDRVVLAKNAGAAASALRAEVARARDGVTPQRMRFAGYAASWLARKAAELEPSTLDRYGRSMLRHILPTFGEFYLDAIQPTDVVDWRDKLSRTQMPATVNGHLRVLRTILADAAAELRTHDPAARVKQISEAKARNESEANVLTGPQLRKVLGAMRKLSPDVHTCALTLAYSGLRWSEVSALRWSSVDFDTATIAVERKRWKNTEGPPKTGVRRTIPIVPELEAALRTHRVRLIAERRATDLVFPGDQKKRSESAGRVARFRSRTWIANALRLALDAAELPAHFTPHGWRHTWNDLLRRVSAGEVVQAITGHSTRKMRDHYSHVDEGEKQMAARGALRLVRK
jgi:integrase